MKAIHNLNAILACICAAVVNIVKSKNESNSQRGAQLSAARVGCCKYR